MLNTSTRFEASASAQEYASGTLSVGNGPGDLGLDMTTGAETAMKGGMFGGLPAWSVAVPLAACAMLAVTVGQAPRAGCCCHAPAWR